MTGFEPRTSGIGSDCFLGLSADVNSDWGQFDVVGVNPENIH